MLQKELKEADTDHNGLIDFQEFQHYFQRMALYQQNEARKQRLRRKGAPSGQLSLLLVTMDTRKCSQRLLVDFLSWASESCMGCTLSGLFRTMKNSLIHLICKLFSSKCV